MDKKWGSRGRNAGPGLGKESLQVKAKLRTGLRRSMSTSELTTASVNSRKPIVDRNGVSYPRVHPALPRPDAMKSDKENKMSVRPTLGIKRAATVPSAATSSIKKTKPEETKGAPSKKIPLYDYKARFNDLLEKHKPMKAEFLVLKRNQDELSEELEELRNLKERYSLDVEGYIRTIEENTQLITKLTNDCKTLTEKCEATQDENWRLQEKVCHFEFEMDKIKDKLEVTMVKLKQSKDINKQQEGLILKQKKDVEELQESTQKLHWERRSLHNKLQDLKGNIRVVFRVRPALSVGRTVADMNFPDACTIEMERYEPGASKRLAKHDFKFDRVFGPMSSQEDVWEEVSCLIQSALDGYNVCIFAYGQTGSGKTYTMEGTMNDPGVIPRSCTMIFESIKQLSRSGWNYVVHASFLEIYNEQIFDLLEPGRDPKDLDIRMADAKGTDVFVTNLSELQVNSAHELLKLANRAQMNRQTAATAGNERSSRSHSVTRVRLVATHTARSLTLSSRICLVDLAGSESAKTTQRLKETKNINRSLSELGQVILALQQKQEHVPFRNSKLTRLLEPQLGGAAKALLVAAAAPYDDCSHESLSTLRFATQVGHCSTAAARRNLALAQPTVAQAKDC